MKKLVLAVLAVASVVLMAGCGRNSSKKTSDEETTAVVRTYDFTGFDRINAGRILDVERRASINVGSISVNNSTYSTDILTVNIVKSEEYSVKMVVPKEEDADVFDVTQEGDELTVWINRIEDEDRDVDTGRSGLKEMRRKYDQKAEVTICMPELKGLTVDGSAIVNVDGAFETEDDFSIEVTGVALVEGLDVKAGRVDVDVTGAANFKACRFSAQDRLSFDFTGAARMAECALTADCFKADITGASLISGSTAQFEDGKLELTGACKLNIDSAGSDPKGTEATCGSLDIEVDGLARVDLSGLRCRDVRVEAGGMSRVKVYATESLWYETEDMARVKYYGNPAEVTGDKDGKGQKRGLSES